MSLYNCNCPPAEQLNDFTPNDCGDKNGTGQIQKLAIWRNGKVIWGSSNVTNVGTAGVPQPDSTILVKADWDARLTAPDESRIVVTPYLFEAKITAGDPITVGGGDNSTLNGVEEVQGYSPSTLSFKIKNPSGALIRDFKDIFCRNDIRIACFTGDGGILVNTDLPEGRSGELLVDSSTISGIQVIPTSVKIPDLTNEGFGVKDYIEITLQLPAQWSTTKRKLYSNQFNSVLDLVNS